jgi:hypothetical protein
VALCVAAAAVCAAALTTGGFRAVLAVLSALSLAVIASSALRLRRRWAGAAEAARWIEGQVPLDDRLITLATARAEDRAARVWPELERDNEVHLSTWRGQRLGIPRAPASLPFLLVALLIAAFCLAPWRAVEETPPSPSGLSGEGTSHDPGGDAGAPGERSAIPGGELGGDRVADGASRSDQAESSGASAGGQGAQADAAAVAAIQDGLEQAFRKSLAGHALAARSPEADGKEKGETEDTLLAKRSDRPETGIGDTQSQEGGERPGADRARLEKTTDPGEKDFVQGDVRKGAGTQPGAKGGKKGEGDGSREGEERPPSKGAEAQQGKGRGKGDSGSGNPTEGSSSGAGKGGPRAGSGKGQGPLYAPRALTLDGGRTTARFALTLGATLGGRGDDGGPQVDAEPRSRIASGEQAGEQAAERRVRHEEIPPDYEGVIKRIFERTP